MRFILCLAALLSIAAVPPTMWVTNSAGVAVLRQPPNPTRLFNVARLAVVQTPPSVTLGWDGVSTATSYVLYSGGASRVYTNFVTTTGTSVTVSNILVGAPNYFAVTAVNVIGLESDFSSELVFSVIGPPTNRVLRIWPQTAPSVSGPWLDYQGPFPVTITNPVGPAYWKIALTNWVQ